MQEQGIRPRRDRLGEMPELDHALILLHEEFSEIHRDGMSGQLDRQSMDYILRDNGIEDAEMRRWCRWVWRSMAEAMREDADPKADAEKD